MAKPNIKVSINLEKIKKHRFWILLTVMIIAGLVTWNIATGALNATYQANATKVNSAYSQLNGVRADMPPNDAFIEVLKKEQDKLGALSLDAWQLFYQEQGEKLKWPTLVADIGNLAPSEDIPERLRASYRNNVVEPEIERIFTKANLRRLKPGVAAAPAPGMANEAQRPDEFEGVVYWDPKKRNELRDRYLPTEIPSTVRVRCTQEDLWIFESLVDIVLTMNEGKTDSIAAVIKSIDLLEVGPPAVEAVMENPGLETEAAPRPNMAKDLTESEDPDLRLLTNRYLDESNKPVDPKVVKETPPFAEFRQVFVVMRFVMDQRRIPELLTACANSHLPIEARQVLLTFTDVDSTQDVRAPVNAAINAGKVERGPYDALVEVRGIVYLYNKPDKDKLGTGSAPAPARRQLGVPMEVEEQAEAPQF